MTEPLAPIATSPSYQPIPNGAFGSWIANRTGGVPGLKPLTVMTSFSAKPGVVSTWTEAVACSAQPSGRPWVRTILKLNEPAACAGEANEAPQASAAASPRAARIRRAVGRKGHLVSSCRAGRRGVPRRMGGGGIIVAAGFRLSLPARRSVSVVPRTTRPSFVSSRRERRPGAGEDPTDCRAGAARRRCPRETLREVTGGGAAA